MSDERIHKHDWENGRCKVCGVSQHPAGEESPDAPMSRRELRARLDKIESQLGRAESFTHILFAALVVLLMIFLLRGC